MNFIFIFFSDQHVRVVKPNKSQRGNVPPQADVTGTKTTTAQGVYLSINGYTFRPKNSVSNIFKFDFLSQFLFFFNSYSEKGNKTAIVKLDRLPQATDGTITDPIDEGRMNGYLFRMRELLREFYLNFEFDFNSEATNNRRRLPRKPKELPRQTDPLPADVLADEGRIERIFIPYGELLREF